MGFEGRYFDLIWFSTCGKLRWEVCFLFVIGGKEM
jgi:hypothetical protein